MSVAGDSESRDKLIEIVASEPRNVIARSQLASYFSAFDRHAEAADVLLKGLPDASDEGKASLIKEAVMKLATAGLFARATEIVSSFLRTSKDERSRMTVLVALADLASQTENKDVESAALERVLEIEPTDSEVRFRLAYLYRKMNLDRLAMYHYRTRLHQGENAVSENNLAITFGILGLPSKAVELLEGAAETFTLAKANLSHASVDGGFLLQAERLATEVLASGEKDETAQARAVDALARVKTMRESENNAEMDLIKNAHGEAAFRARYAEAYIAEPAKGIDGYYETPYGLLSFEQSGNRLIGTGRYEEEEGKGLFITLSSAQYAEKRLKIRTVRLEANLVGHSGVFTLQIEQRYEGTLVFVPASQATTTHGLMIVAKDGIAFDALEEEAKNKAKIWQTIRQKGLSTGQLEK